MSKLRSPIEIIGVNPFIYVPERILKKLFKQAGKEKGPIAICGHIKGKPYKQTLVKYKGAWRLYINTTMLKDSPRRIGEIIEITIDFDSSDRSVAAHPEFIKALSTNSSAKEQFEKLPPYHQKEILRYLSSLKTTESLERNIQRAINYLTGKERFVGRKPLKR